MNVVFYLPLILLLSFLHNEIADAFETSGEQYFSLFSQDRLQIFQRSDRTLSFVSGNCTFDQNSFCEWTNEVGDHFNWTLKEGPTGTKHTGPSKDHSGKQYYTQALNGGRFRPDCELAQV